MANTFLGMVFMELHILQKKCIENFAKFVASTFIGVAIVSEGEQGWKFIVLWDGVEMKLLFTLNPNCNLEKARNANKHH